MPKLADIAHALRNPLATLAKARRNAPIAEALFRMAFADRDEQRLSAADSMVSLIRQKQLVLESGTALRAATKTAADFLALPAVRSRLEGTPHLGCLAPLADVSASRLSYVAFHLEALSDMKLAFSGIGLGSANFGVEYNGRPLSGLDIVQLAAIGTNIGHLFGTFATERALMFQLDASPPNLRRLLAYVDQEARSLVEYFLERRSLYRFYYTLALIKAAAELRPKRRRTLIVSYPAYFSQLHLS